MARRGTEVNGCFLAGDFRLTQISCVQNTGIAIERARTEGGFRIAFGPLTTAPQEQCNGFHHHTPICPRTKLPGLRPASPALPTLVAIPLPWLFLAIRRYSCLDDVNIRFDRLQR